MHDTLPPILSVWSGLAAPLCCLANKSQARLCSESLQSALEANLSGPGSMIYQTVWKPHVTPLGRQIYRLRASGRRTSDSEPSLERSGWPTPQCADVNHARGTAEYAFRTMARAQPPSSLALKVHLSGWPTPMAGTPAQNGNNEAGNNDSSRKTVALSGWPSPGASDGNGGKGPRTGVSMTGRMPDGSKVTMGLPATAKLALSGWPTPNAVNGDRTAYKDFDKLMARKAAGRQTNLQEIVMVAGWPTPEAEEARRGYQNRSNGKKGSQESMTTAVINALGDKPHLTPHGAARITADGTMLTGCSAGMESGGQLNPAFSGWLMGFPEAWCHAAISCRLPPRLRKAPKKPAA